MTTEQKLNNYIRAIHELAKSKIAGYKSKAIMDENPLFDYYGTKIKALEDFVKDANLERWADDLSKDA